MAPKGTNFTLPRSTTNRLLTILSLFSAPFLAPLAGWRHWLQGGNRRLFLVLLVGRQTNQRKRTIVCQRKRQAPRDVARDKSTGKKDNNWTRNTLAALTCRLAGSAATCSNAVGHEERAREPRGFVHHDDWQTLIGQRLMVATRAFN